MLHVSAARVDITVAEDRLGMMGWGMLHNIVEDVGTPLHARAFVVLDPASGTRLAMVVCELAFISIAIREEVCRLLREVHPELGFDRENVMLMGTHTHSGPGGFTHYPFYNVTIPGFAPRVWEGLAAGITRAIVQAHADLVPGRLRWAEGAFAPDLEVAFNRSVGSYNRNPDVTPVDPSTPELAIDRTMRLLRLETADGRPIGAINWFPVHCTSVHSDNTSLHFDNKGYAARFLEDALAARGEPEFVGAFAQGAAGDVTPNFRRHPGRPWVRGKYPDDDASARFNGRLQFEQALSLLDAATEGPSFEPRLDAVDAYVDFADVEVDPRFCGGRRGCRTGPAEIGMAMFFGTEEGPGLPRSLVGLQRVAAALRPRWRKLRGIAGQRRADVEIQGEKITWLETGRRRALGVAQLRRLPVPWFLHPALRLVRELDRSDDPDAKPWTPQVLPVQLFVLGPLAILAVPAEFTTMSGRRLCDAVARSLAEIGVDRAVLAGYANGYAGYVTTAEEYAVQDYEGASTHFGRWTQAAYMTVFDRLADRLRQPRDGRDPAPRLRPPTFSPAELATRMFQPTGPAISPGSTTPRFGQ